MCHAGRCAQSCYMGVEHILTHSPDRWNAISRRPHKPWCCWRTLYSTPWSPFHERVVEGKSPSALSNKCTLPQLSSIYTCGGTVWNGLRGTSHLQPCLQRRRSQFYGRQLCTSLILVDVDDLTMMQMRMVSCEVLDALRICALFEVRRNA